MNYVGIDYHKAYSVLAAMNERGQLLQEARIPGNSPVAFDLLPFTSPLAKCPLDGAEPTAGL
jgi:hypothetical protein